MKSSRYWWWIHPSMWKRTSMRKGIWVRPVAKQEEARIKLLRKHILIALIALLDAVAQHGPAIVVGLGQGGLIAALASMPLLLEQACRYRVVGMEEMASYRVSWSKVLAHISINPEKCPRGLFSRM